MLICSVGQLAIGDNYSSCKPAVSWVSSLLADTPYVPGFGGKTHVLLVQAIMGRDMLEQPHVAQKPDKIDDASGANNTGCICESESKLLAKRERKDSRNLELRQV